MKNKKTLLELDKILVKLKQLHTSFDYIRITLASPARIRSWAERILPSGETLGEIKKSETINFRNHEPEINGLFCEKIFGPIKNWKCKCGKYNGFVLDKICEECQVEIIESRVRRYRTGYIDLVYPVIHLWYLKGIPNYLCILLRGLQNKLYNEIGTEMPYLKISDLENIVYFKKENKDIHHSLIPFLYSSIEINKNEIIKFTENISLNKNLIIKKRKGAEIIKAALESLDLKIEIKKWRSLIDHLKIHNFSFSCIDFPEYTTALKRIRILESFLSSKTNPSWMILSTLPVLPPTLRPLIELENGRLVTADINEIYRMIINRNQSLSEFFYDLLIPEMISFHGKKLLQESVDSLIDNARIPKEKQFILNNKVLKSLTEILEGKEGRFRQSLLGKRVDYSGRSVIIVGPTLRLNQCGLPYEMAKELFQPFLINKLLNKKIKTPNHNRKLAQIIIKKNKPFIWTLLVFLIKKYSVLLNRAPTLHRFGIQAFDSLLVLGKAIHLHPLVCTGFNADFDGDQMAVHLPLYEVSQLEIKTMMRPSYNVLSPSNGEVILKPTQDMVIGCYYLTLMITNYKHLQKKWFSNETDVLISFYQKKINIHTSILVRYSIENIEFKIINKKIEFFNPLISILQKTQQVNIYKIFNFETSNKYYLLTNLGIILCYKITNIFYQITDIFIETTAGRLIFNKNFKNSLKE
jgi:DNA-directed RNA polymerase subunit beta'